MSDTTSSECDSPWLLNACADLSSSPLDKKTKKPQKVKELKIRKLLELPSIEKWLSYNRKCVIPFTLNPADNSRESPFTKLWYELTVSGKIQRVKKLFTNNVFKFNDYFITIELSQTGRLHFHGLLYVDFSNKLNQLNYNKFIDDLLSLFSIKNYKNKWNNPCFKGNPMNSTKDEDLIKSYNYITKDVQYMFQSNYRIRYITHVDCIKIIQVKEELKFFG